MTTTRHPHDGSSKHAGSNEHKSPIEERLEARIAEERERAGAKTADPDDALAEANNRYVRLAADFENYKRRTRQEQLDTIQHAASDLIARLLPALDDLRNALDHRPAGVDETWAKGIELAVRKLEEAMAAHGLEPIESVGSAFDPKVHEAIGHEESA